MSFLPRGLSAVFRAGDFGVSSRNIPLQFVGEVFLRRDERKRSAKFINNFILQVLGLCGIYSLASTIDIHLYGIDNENFFLQVVIQSVKKNLKILQISNVW